MNTQSASAKNCLAVRLSLKCTWLLAGSMLLHGLASAQVTPEPAVSGTIQAKDSLLFSAGNIFNGDGKMEKWLKDNHIPVLGLGTIVNGKLNQAKVFGNLKSGEQAPDNTIFNVASLTKPVTAVVTLKLVSEGKWSLDEPLYNYWTDPDIKDDPRHKKLTTRIVLSHQTGFANWRWLNASKKLEFAFDPGTKYQYSGEGLEYLRKALEKKFKQPLERLAEQYIFNPLKMHDTWFVWNDSLANRFSDGYDPKGEIYPVNKNKEASAADDLLTSVKDYGKFLESVIAGEGLSPKIFTEMTGHQVKTKENKYFGLGWEIYDNLGNGEYALSHGGSDKGVQTVVFLLPKSKSGLIIFTNVDNGYKIFEKLIIAFLGDKGKAIVDIEMKK